MSKSIDIGGIIGQRTEWTRIKNGFDLYKECGKLLISEKCVTDQASEMEFYGLNCSLPFTAEMRRGERVEPPIGASVSYVISDRS